MSVAQTRRFLRERRFDSALGCAEKLVETRPARVEGYELRAEALLRTGRLEEALGDLDRALALAPSGSERLRLHDARGELLRRLGRLAEAEAEAGRRIALAPRDAGGYLARAEARRGLGRFAAAERDLGRAAALDPRQGWVHAVRAKVLRAARRTAAALQAAERAVALEPGHAKAWAWRGEVLRALGRREEAAESLRRALALDAGCAWARALLGQTLVELGEEGKGEAELEAALALDSRGSGVYDFLAGGAGLAADPLCAWVHAWDGCARAAAGDAAGAEDAFARSLSLDARRAWVWRRRGRARLERGEGPGAIEDFARASALSPRRGLDRFWLGEALRQDGKLEAAVAALNAAVALEPRLAAAYGGRALAKLALGDEGGFDDWRSACALDAGFGERAERALVQAGLWDENVRRTLRRGGGRDEAAWTAWAEERFARGRGRAARPELEAAARRDPLSAELRWLCWRALDDDGRGGPRPELEAAVALGLERAEAWGALGAARLAERRLVPALEAFERAAVLHGEDPWSRASGAATCAGALTADGRKRALSQLRRLGRSPAAAPAALRPRWSAVRADLLRSVKRFDEALAELRRAEPLFSRCLWRWRCALGELALKAGRAAEARRELDAAVALAPARALPRCWRGELRYWQGDHAGARAELAAAAAAEPKAAWAQAWHGLMLLWLGEPARARAALDAALALDASLAWAYGWRGAAAIVRGDPEGGLRDLERALALDPMDVEARAWKGEALARLGRRAAALAELDGALALDPGRLWPRLVRAWTRLTAGRRAEALDDLRQARRLAPEWLALRRAGDAAALERLLAEAKGNRTYRRLHA